MLQQERHNQILAKLNLEGQVIVKELSQAFNVTEDCIRKDLTALEKAGLLKRIHGGAIQVRENLHTINVNERLKIHSPENNRNRKLTLRPSRRPLELPCSAERALVILVPREPAGLQTRGVIVATINKSRSF